MSLLLQGIILGIVLSFAIGPLLFTLLQTSLDRGVPSGLAVGVGIWMSDIMFIAVLFLGMSYIQNVVSLPDFSFIGGMLGAVVLLAVGITMIVDRRLPDRAVVEGTKAPRIRKRTYFGLWVKGFLINTINPFTVFFWVAISTNTLGHESFTFEHVGGFFIGLMCALIIFDVVKIFAANRIRQLLTDAVILKVRHISGAVLILFAVGLMIRVALI